jgi:hypothetical protein
MTYLMASFALADGRHDAVGADMMSVTRIRQGQRGYPWMSHLVLVKLLAYWCRKNLGILSGGEVQC